MDPHKRSATIEVMAGDESILGGGRYGTGTTGYRVMLADARQWPDRTWAVEGCQGIGGRSLCRSQSSMRVPEGPRFSSGVVPAVA
jgi:hypothetical protein